MFTSRKGIVIAVQTQVVGWLFFEKNLLFEGCAKVCVGLGSRLFNGSSTTLTCACPLIEDIVESLQSSRLKKKLETTLPIGVHRCKKPFFKPGQARQK